MFVTLPYYTMSTKQIPMSRVEICTLMMITFVDFKSSELWWRINPVRAGCPRAGTARAASGVSKLSVTTTKIIIRP